MEPGFQAFLWGTLALAVGLLAGGFWVDGALGKIMIVIGGLGLAAWTFFIFWLCAALNSDI